MDFQRHILQGPKRFVLRAAEQRPRCAKRPREHVPQRAVSLAVPDAVALAQSFHAYRDVAHFRLALSCLILVAIIHQLRLIDGLQNRNAFGRNVRTDKAESQAPSTRRARESRAGATATQENRHTLGRSASYEPTPLNHPLITPGRLPSLPSFGRTITRPGAAVAPLPPRPAKAHRASGRAPSAPTGILRSLPPSGSARTATASLLAPDCWGTPPAMPASRTARGTASRSARHDRARSTTKATV